MTKPPQHAGDDQGRSRQNLLVAGALVLLLVLGLWLFHELRGYLRIEACVEAGYRDCDTRN